MALDRAIGVVCIALAAAAGSVALVAGASSPPPAISVDRAFDHDLGPTDDPETTAAFLDYYERAERGAWALDAAWERRRGDEVTLGSEWRQVQDGTGNQLIAALGSLVGTYDGRIIACGPIENQAELCEAGVAPDPLRTFEQSADIAAEATIPNSGSYTVARAPDRTMLDEDTECFVVRVRPGHVSRAFGSESTYCYSDDAIPLLVVRHQGGAVDNRTATAYSLDVDDSDFDELLAVWADALLQRDLRSSP